MATKNTAQAAGIKPVKEPLNRTGLVTEIAADTDLSAKDVKRVLASLEAKILGSVHKRGAGEFTLAGLFKATVVKVPAKPKRKGRNPFTGEEQVFAAKPATVKVKIRPLKKLKDAAL